MRELVDELCSEACAGRAPGSPEGARARAAVVRALRGAGLDPFEQPVPGCRGANVIATLPGDVDRWVIVGAHFDHLGRWKGEVFWGADDNAAAVAILAEVAKGAARRRPAGRGVAFVAFDGEEPPYFLTEAMGSRHFASRPPVPLERVDLMVCMDLVGHALGPAGLPGEVRSSLFALGAERSAGTAARVDGLAAAEPGVVLRRVDAEAIPPLSDYEPFWRRRVPFLFLTAGRSRHYHSPSDTPETLDFAKMAATARWLDRFVRETCARPEGRVEFLQGARDDASTLRSVAALTEALAPVSAEAALGRAEALRLLALCDREGRLPGPCRPEAAALVMRLESALA
ncbi:MAG TPA: M28 family peptidase [Polyangiaceae bacterium]|nr:M28 family peptidase [Polyangiaceae bacterium]